MNKHHKLLIAWFLISGLIVFTAVRQIQVAAASQIQAHQPLPPPAKTRHAIRPAVLPWSGDPVADYVARCGKGMTNREIRWILEDIQIAGLYPAELTDKTPGELLISYRAAQRRWYHGALVDGLRLTHEQSAQAADKLSELFENAITQFREESEPGGKKLDNWMSTRFQIVVAYLWLFDRDDVSHRHMPWNLCPLTSQQEKITWKNVIPPEFDVADKSEKTDQPLFKNPHPQSYEGRNPEQWALVDTILPFLKLQNFSPEGIENDETENGLLAKIRHLHPAQFKILLLLYPDLAGKLGVLLQSESR